MFMDISSELIHSLLPVFMATFLVASMTTIGLIEGAGEASTAITKVFSGAISDYFGKRKWLEGLGYGLAAMTKPIFPLAKTIGWVFPARFIDRIGKGIRGAPLWGIHMGLTQGLFAKLLADNAPYALRGTAFGIFNLVSGHCAVVCERRCRRPLGCLRGAGHLSGRSRLGSTFRARTACVSMKAFNRPTVEMFRPS